MKRIPDSVAAYKKTPVFTDGNVPNGLLNEHQTKQGVWGKIVVLNGKLRYTISNPEEIVTLDADHFGVVEPTVIHRVEPLGEVVFYVEFYR